MNYIILFCFLALVVIWLLNFVELVKAIRHKNGVGFFGEILLLITIMMMLFFLEI